ncbi:MAG: hypothetical protein ACXIVG_10235 [Pararhodobacter sp.]
MAILLAIVALFGLPGAPFVTGHGAQAETVSVAAREGRRNLAFNLAAHGDWSTQQPFIDIIRLARPWEGHLRGQWGGVSEAELITAGHLDENGWVLSVPGNVVKLASLVLVDMPAEMTSLAGRYHVSWEGSAHLGFSGLARNVRYTGRNSATFEYTPGPGLVIVEFNRGDLRNLTIVHERHLERFADGEIFNPDWLALIGDAENLRLMDWMATNNSELVEWSDRPQISHYTWARGVPVEILLELANQTGAEPWFTLPHLASDDYIRRFGEMVREWLRPDLRAWVEFSNEVWNWSFAQAQWAEDQGRARWNRENVWVQYYALRASEMVRILDQVFADEPERLVRVLGFFTAWLGLESDILNPPLLRAEDPSAPPPYTLFDTYAVTGYFSADLHSEPRRPMVQAWLDESLRRAEAQADAEGLSGAERSAFVESHRFDHAIDMAGRELMDGAVSGDATMTVQGLLDSMLSHHAAVAAAHDLALVMYEGGTHVVAMPDQHDDDDLIAFFTALNYSAEMGALYTALIEGWHALTVAPFNAYFDVGVANRWGSWGHRRHLDDDNPRWQALMQATMP